MNKIILASQSPRRKELMELLEMDFIVAKSDVDELFDETLEFHEIAMDLASQKANDVARFFGDSIILGFDTIVIYEKHILGKPKDQEEAKNMLRMLSGHKHQVMTGVAIYYQGKTEVFYASTDVVFNDITDEEIEAYILSNEYSDKAGAYGIQGKAARFVKEINGDFYNVMGLPVSSLYQALKKYEK